MSELKGLTAGVRVLVGDENFRNGSQSAVEFEPYVVDLGLGRNVSLAPLRAILEEARTRKPAKWSDSDGWLAPRVHATLRLTRREAADRRLWAYLNVAMFPGHVRWRWLDPEEEGAAVPIDRFLGEDSKNHLGRLWWGAELTRNGHDYARTERAFRNSRFSVSWQVLDMMHHRPAALAIVDFLEQFNDGQGATDSQGSRMARALNAALRTLALDAVTHNPEPDAEAFREWFSEPIDETKMMDELPKGPDEKEPVSEEAVGEVRRHLDGLAKAIRLGEYVRKHKPRMSAALQAFEGGDPVGDDDPPVRDDPAPGDPAMSPEAVIEHLGGGSRIKAHFYALTGGQKALVIPSRHYPDKNRYWYGPSPAVLKEIEELGITHVAFGMGTRAIALVPVPEVMEIIKGTTPSRNKDSIKHYHVYISDGLEPEIYGGANSPKMPLKPYLVVCSADA